MLLLLNSAPTGHCQLRREERDLIQVPNLSAAPAFAFAASSSRFLDAAFVSSERRRRVEIPAIPSTAAMNEASFAFGRLIEAADFSHELQRRGASLFRQ